MTWTDMKPRRSAVEAVVLLGALYAVILTDLWWSDRREAALPSLGPSAGETATLVLGFVVQFLVLWGVMMLARLVQRRRRLGRAG